jgi:hypothetical protein
MGWKRRGWIVRCIVHACDDKATNRSAWKGPPTRPPCPESPCFISHAPHITPSSSNLHPSSDSDQRSVQGRKVIASNQRANTPNPFQLTTTGLSISLAFCTSPFNAIPPDSEASFNMISLSRHASLIDSESLSRNVMMVP